MTLTLYFHEISPPSRSVLMIIKALNIQCDVKVVDLLTGEQFSPEYLEIHPRGKVPALTDGDFTLIESRAIAAYLCNKYGGVEETLYPRDPEKRANVDMMLYFGGWVYNEIFAYLNVRNILFYDEKICDENLPKVHEALKQLENYLEKNKFMAGTSISIADFFGVNAVLFLEVSDFEDYGKYPKVVEWIKEVKKLPYFNECNQSGLAHMKKLIKNKLEKKYIKVFLQ